MTCEAAGGIRFSELTFLTTNWFRKRGLMTSFFFRTTNCVVPFGPLPMISPSTALKYRAWEVSNVSDIQIICQSHTDWYDLTFFPGDDRFHFWSNPTLYMSEGGCLLSYYRYWPLTTPASEWQWNRSLNGFTNVTILRLCIIGRITDIFNGISLWCFINYYRTFPLSVATRPQISSWRIWFISNMFSVQQKVRICFFKGFFLYLHGSHRVGINIGELDNSIRALW